MVHFSAVFSCFVPSSSSSSSSRVADDAVQVSGMKAPNVEKPKSKPKSSSAPIVVSYFPMNSYMSRL
ncbi:hypothetical protein P3X46_024280 [Hevea brasiliensis]|uniref:Secreted protein n=1 Tax=Hevea brasiliensis TaxID=3981 RepID=A0ABQ9L3Q0_HEVBR|nr:hypothetical protein P3X46_024278 [Hevea brasiliensis]KAJ9158720.1 hypothetical protein P3X46_024280 [Hevea brasiliensis]